MAKIRLHLQIDGKEVTSVQFDGDLRALQGAFSFECDPVLEPSDQADMLNQVRYAVMTESGPYFFRWTSVGLWWFTEEAASLPGLDDSVSI